MSHRAVVTESGNAQDASMRFVRGSALRWWVSFALLLPVIALYTCEYLRGGFTGFIQYDQPYYMANARKFFDGGFHFL
jgi:hypothetical protein